jgi:hypothetical protein
MMGRRLHSTEGSLFDLSGWLLTVVTIEEIVAGGLLVAKAPAANVGNAPPGRQVRFQLGLASGEVRGLAEVIRTDVDRHELVLRLLEIENEGGLPRLLELIVAD